MSSRLTKLGGTEIALDKGDISLTLDEGVNLSPGEINALRRSAIDALVSTERSFEKNKKFDRIYHKRQTKVVKTAYFYAF